MTASAQLNPEVLTVDATGFAAITISMLPEGVWVSNTTTGLLHLSQYVAGVMTLVLKGNGQIANTPTSPELFVSSAGSDALSQPGTLVAPLATPQEAARRHGLTGWLIDAFVTCIDAINLGANPLLSVPLPLGNARPMTFRGRLSIVAGCAGIACTGGTPGTYTGASIIGATFTSANASAPNALRGQILLPTAGALVGNQYIVHANNGGTFTLPAAFLSGVGPAGGSTFDILSRDASWTWTGTLVVTGELSLFNFSMLPGLPGLFWAVDAYVQESGMSWLTATFNLDGFDCKWFSGIWSKVLPYTSGGMIACGNRYEGTTSALTLWTSSNSIMVEGAGNSYQGCNIVPAFNAGDVALSYQGNTFNNCAFIFGRGTSVYMNLGLRVEAGRATAGSAAVIQVSRASQKNQFSGIDFQATVAGNDLIKVDTGAKCLMTGIVGQAAPGRFFLNVLTGGEVVGLSGNGALGGTPTQDVSVDGGTAFPVADANAMGVIGSQNGTFQHSTSDLTANPTINKFSGFGSIATGGPTTSVITNSLADVGDHVRLTPTSINATVAKWSAVATLNTITITTDAAPTVAAWTFSWELLKATV